MQWRHFIKIRCIRHYVQPVSYYCAYNYARDIPISETSETKRLLLTFLPVREQ